MRILFLCIALAAPLASAAGEISPADLATLPRSDVLVLGEFHDNPIHHANQAAAVAASRPKALVFEMLTAEQAARITPEIRGDAAALGAALGWDAAGWPDFAMYFPILAAAPAARVYGASVPRAEAARVTERGPSVVFGPGSARYGLEQALPPDEQARREAEQAEAHCGALPDEMLPAMVEVQRLRDAVLARTAVEALTETGGPVAVITGNGHARTDQGLGTYLSRAESGVTVLSVGQLEAPPETGTHPPYDLWLVTAPAEREDPCAAFR